MHTITRPSLYALIGTLALFTPLVSAQHYFLGSGIGSPSPAMDASFGVSVEIDDRYLAIGSYRDNVSFGHDGRVYLYAADTGAYVQTIHGPNPFNNGAFASSTAIAGDLILVGSRSDQNVQGVGGAGYLFNVNSGALIAHFVSEIGGSGDGAGASVALQEPLALVGAPGYDEGGDNVGAVHAYATNLLFQITTLQPDILIAGELFGTSVAIEGDYIVVGAPHTSSSGTQTGSVYVFDVNTGVQLHRIVPAGSSPGDRVGVSVDINNGVIAIGVPYYDRPGLGASGIVYTYNAASGTLIDTFSPPVPAVLGQFGTSVAIDGDRVVVGSPYIYVDSDYPGSVYIFENGNVEEANVFSLPDSQGFGRHVAAYEGRIVASGSGFGMVEEGYAALIGRFCNADINADGNRDFFDVSAFIKFAIDYNGDGVFDFFDVSAFLADFTSDCV